MATPQHILDDFAAVAADHDNVTTTGGVVDSTAVALVQAQDAANDAVSAHNAAKVALQASLDKLITDLQAHYGQAAQSAIAELRSYFAEGRDKQALKIPWKDLFKILMEILKGLEPLIPQSN